jgi:hypothetical protein
LIGFKDEQYDYKTCNFHPFFGVLFRFLLSPTASLESEGQPNTPTI